MKILVTGGAGFIGMHLSKRLLNDGHVVTIFDNFSPQVHGSNKTLPANLIGMVNLIIGDVRDPDALSAALAGQEAVIHLAAETGTGQSMYEIKRYADVNVGGTAVLLDLLASRGHDVQKVVLASSRAIYGEGKYLSRKLGFVYPRQRRAEDMAKGLFDPLCPATGEPLELIATDEDAKPHPLSVYGITKQTQEQMIMTVCGALGIPATALRYQNVYGPGQSLNNPYTGILSIFSTRIKNHSPIRIFEDGIESRDFVYVDDAVNATVLALTKKEADGEVFGIGSGVPTSVLTVARTLVDCYGITVPIQVTGEYRVGDIRHNYADLSKANRLLSYSPGVDFGEGIARFVAWVNTQDIARDAFDQSIEEMKSRGLMK